MYKREGKGGEKEALPGPDEALLRVRDPNARPPSAGGERHLQQGPAAAGDKMAEGQLTACLRPLWFPCFTAADQARVPPSSPL